MLADSIFIVRRRTELRTRESIPSCLALTVNQRSFLSEEKNNRGRGRAGKRGTIMRHYRLRSFLGTGLSGVRKERDISVT